MPIDDAMLGTWAPKFECPLACILVCNPGSTSEIEKLDDDTIVLKNYCLWGLIPQGGVPCPCCAWCGVGPCRFTPKFKSACAIQSIMSPPLYHPSHGSVALSAPLRVFSSSCGLAGH